MAISGIKVQTIQDQLEVIELTRKYKCITQNEFRLRDYLLIPLRDEDKESIRLWRNEQIDVLRQDEILTVEHQVSYFKDVIAPLFYLSEPSQILFSFFLKEELIGYGGLVHINWNERTAEISFLTKTERNINKEIFINDWVNYLCLIKQVAFEQLNMNSIYTYAYDIRPHLYTALEVSGFKLTKRLSNAVMIGNQYKDVLIHTFDRSDIWFRKAELPDKDQYFAWANDVDVRKNSFTSDEINYEHHLKWFTNKLSSSDCRMYVFLNAINKPIGQVRIDYSNDESVIGISVDKEERGKGNAIKMLQLSTEEYLREYPLREIFAFIKKENTASVEAFKKAGYQFEQEGEKNGTKYILLKSKK